MAARRDLRVVPLVALWFAAVAAGSVALWRYASKPGGFLAPAADWPAATSLPLDRTRYNLVLFAHPRCPCTRATLTELAWLKTQARDRIAVRIVVYKPAREPQEWAKGEILNEAVSMPDVSVDMDADGVEAKRFGAVTSGTVAVYSPSGRLVFRGGITGARGHEGDNPGRRAALAALGKPSKTDFEAPVFGCMLASAAERR